MGESGKGPGDEQHQQVLWQLRERVKELTALQRVSRLLQERNVPLQQILEQIVGFLPDAFLYPASTAIRVRFDGHQAQSPHFVEHECRLQCRFTTADGGYTPSASMQRKIIHGAGRPAGTSSAHTAKSGA